MANKNVTNRGTLTLTGPGTVDTFTFTDDNMPYVRLTNIDGAATVYATVGDGTQADPVNGATGEEHILTAGVGAYLDIPVVDAPSGGLVVKARGAAAVVVQAERRWA